MTRPALLALLLLSVAACRRGTDVTVHVATPPADTVAPIVPPAPATPAPATPAAAPDTTASARPALALDPEGLRLVTTSTGSTRLVAFGTPQADAVRGLRTALGAPTEESANDECPAGPLEFASFRSGVTAWFQNGAFVGWGVDERTDRTMRTMAGVGVGTTRRGLDSVVTATVAESTLGTEFDAGGLYGILSGPRPTDRIVYLWAGIGCNFR